MDITVTELQELIEAADLWDVDPLLMLFKATVTVHDPAGNLTHLQCFGSLSGMPAKNDRFKLYKGKETVIGDVLWSFDEVYPVLQLWNGPADATKLKALGWTEYTP